MKKLRIMGLILAVVMVMACLAGCSGGASMDAMDEGYQQAPEKGYEDGVYESNTSNSGETPESGAALQNQKLIRTVTLDAETDDLAATLAMVEAKVAALGGYMEEKSVRDNSNASYSRRYADLTVRIPADQLDGFVDHVAGQTNIVSEKETTENVTLQYVATQSRVTALETEQQRLLELLAQAQTMSDLLEIESRLTDVRTELEQVASQLRLMDNLVDYATIHLSLSEVKEFTVTEPEDPTYWQRLGETVVESWKELGIILQELSLSIVACIPFLLVMSLPGLVALTIVLITVKAKRRKRRKNP